ncbi:hypothetical protein GQ464_010765 [Rhodocaloribacter litoris]|uniref:hypothetical protein n=1 Tax=Rhodocaloribacter litoris TaxID=2558931 RepID=UPI001E2BE298|nr:hypothetical protein [Rhodocaloribacter litoris]QXD13939.1 hypothetical protein GQ464_010765 [Rhodocaloribacter litoris]
MIQEEALFHALYQASTESEVDEVIQQHPEVFKQENWYPYGQNESNFGVVENQQASPIPALVEKVINSIDAILMKRCLEEGIDPKSPQAPRSVEDAVKRFFPDAKNWDLPSFRAQQAEAIQILADGPRLNTSLVIYDDGEGQHPEDFEDTFLSLLRGNKNEIHFVQGKYNMGGAGAIVFCGKKRYQLIGSKRFDGTGLFGFTLMRKHPLSDEERKSKKNTWYEYLKIDGKIPSFHIDTMDLGLYNRLFKTGTVIKLYSYDLPEGARSVISRDLNQSINEYLFEPALPIYTIDKEERYPNDRALQRHLYGLKRRLEEEGSKYVETYFSETYSDETIGTVKITCYVFKPRIEGKNAKESRETIQREFFKNNMSVLFSINGQVHGHYTSEFITRSLKFSLLKGYLIIHVDCTHVNLEFRNELFMASRDRLKAGEESRTLRHVISDVLSKSKLKDIYKQRRQAITVEGEDTKDLLKSFTDNLPLKDDLLSLLNQTFKLDQKTKREPQPKQHKPSQNNGQQPPPFNPQRFPSFLKIEVKAQDKDGLPMVKVPLGGERTARFSTDVEDHYFDRVEEPGDLQIAILDYRPNEREGGSQPGIPDKVEYFFNVARSSPNQGIIRIAFNPTDKVQVGDAVKIKATLMGAGQKFEEIFWIKISEPEKKQNKQKAKPSKEDDRIGLPALHLVYEEKRDGYLDWEALEAQGISMNHDTVMHPSVEGDKLDAIYVNMDSRVLKDYKSKLKTAEQLDLADKRYISSVYFHTLFLYMITRNRKYTIYQQQGGHDEEPVDLTDYLKDIFESYYSAFLLNFEMSELIASLED